MRRGVFSWLQLQIDVTKSTHWTFKLLDTQTFISVVCLCCFPISLLCCVSTGGMYHGDMTEKLKLLYKLHLPPGNRLPYECGDLVLILCLLLCVRGSKS